jgi:hypothetical protein
MVATQRAHHEHLLICCQMSGDLSKSYKNMLEFQQSIGYSCQAWLGSSVGNSCQAWLSSSVGNSCQTWLSSSTGNSCQAWLSSSIGNSCQAWLSSRLFDVQQHFLFYCTENLFARDSGFL